MWALSNIGDYYDMRTHLSTCKDISSGLRGGGLRVVVSTAAFHARVRGSVPGLGGLKETKMFLRHPGVKVSIVAHFISLYVHKDDLKPDSFHFLV